MVAGLVVAQAAAAGAHPKWRIVESSGAVMVTSDDARCLLADPGRDLPAGAVIETGVEGSVTVMRGDDTVTVSPESKLTFLPQVGAETRVGQQAGMAWFKIGKRSAPHFAVQTPELTATVKGTTFTVAIDAAGAAVHVREGAVEVATSWRDAVTLVRSGTMARVQRQMSDRILLMNGGNVLRTVMGYDTSSSGEPALRRSGGPGTLFAENAVHVDKAVVRTRLSDAAPPVLRTAQPAARLSSPAIEIGLTSSPPPRQRVKNSGLPMLETGVAALILLILMIGRTFFGAGRKPKPVRVDTRRG